MPIAVWALLTMIKAPLIGHRSLQEGHRTQSWFYSGTCGGGAYEGQGRLDEAIGALNKAIELKPDLTPAYYHLGNTYGKQGNFDAAIEAFKKAIELNPDYAQAYADLGGAYEGQGRLDEAIGAFKKAIELKPDYAEVYDI